MSHTNISGSCLINNLKKTKKMILGVSGWLSEKLGWSVSTIRILFVVGILIFGVGLGLYLILWLVKMFSK